MHERTARALIALNNRFYRRCAASFDATRSAPWTGWRRVLDAARSTDALDRADAGDGTRILDLACGNLRFERFLARELGGTPVEVYALDACRELMGAAEGTDLPPLRIRELDVLGALLAGDTPLQGIPLVDLSACFGFMHHVPGATLRQRLVDALAGQTRPGGVIALSFWRFMDDARLASKAREADERASAVLGEQGVDVREFDEGDHFLGWQDDARALRYCHHVTEAEIDALVAGCSHPVREIDRFFADGRSGMLNRYLILQRR